MANNFLNFANRVPAMNAQARKRLDAGKALQMQQLAKSAPAGTSATRAAQEVAPALTEQTGQQQLALDQQQKQQQAQLAGAALNQQQVEQQAALESKALQQQEQLQQKGLQQGMDISREQTQMQNALTDEEIASAQRMSNYGLQIDEQLSSMSRKMRSDLAALGGDVKQKLFDANLAFDRNELGRKFTNHRQVLKAAVASAKNQQDLKQKLTAMQQTAAKEMILLEGAHKRMVQALQNGYLDEKRELDQDQRRRLSAMAEQIRKKIERKKRQAANQSMIIQGVFTAGGAIIGGAPGAMIGSGVGQTVAGASM